MEKMIEARLARTGSEAPDPKLRESNDEAPAVGALVGTVCVPVPLTVVGVPELEPPVKVLVLIPLLDETLGEEVVELPLGTDSVPPMLLLEPGVPPVTVDTEGSDTCDVRDAELDGSVGWAVVATLVAVTVPDATEDDADDVFPPSLLTADVVLVLLVALVEVAVEVAVGLGVVCVIREVGVEVRVGLGVVEVGLVEVGAGAVEEEVDGGGGAVEVVVLDVSVMGMRVDEPAGGAPVPLVCEVALVTPGCPGEVVGGVAPPEPQKSKNTCRSSSSDARSTGPPGTVLSAMHLLHASRALRNEPAPQSWGVRPVSWPIETAFWHVS